ncbi:MAG: aa3-type cytochrome c oxidase subunit IV [Alphaproteobacteria bacterium]|nr:aa3-type cytochrome c oxidase subunit IV [Alphaproteobacteria bacterium]
MADSDPLDDLKSHEEMWDNFVKIMIYAGATTVVTLVLLALFLL